MVVVVVVLLWNCFGGSGSGGGGVVLDLLVPIPIYDTRCSSIVQKVYFTNDYNV